MDEQITVADAARLLGVTTGRVGRYIAAGTLPAVRFGQRQWLLQRRDVEAFAALPRRPGRPRKKGDDEWPLK